MGLGRLSCASPIPIPITVLSQSFRISTQSNFNSPTIFYMHTVYLQLFKAATFHFYAEEFPLRFGPENAKCEIEQADGLVHSCNCNCATSLFGRQSTPVIANQSRYFVSMHYLLDI